MNQELDFSTPAITRIRIAEDVSIAEVGQAFEGTLITIRIAAGGGFIICRRRPGERDRRIRQVDPPEPPRAA